IKTAYPIHPEVFDRLYEDWSTVDRFQRTRGVLRLMAAVINSLWESDDRSPLILPCSIPLDDGRVNGELAGKLPDYWAPVIYADRDRYWFDRQQNVNRTARDDAARLLSGDKHEVRAEIERRLKSEKGDGDFRRVHVAPPTNGDVADDAMVRLVVIGPDHPHIA